jgi:acetyl esterase
MTIATTPVLEPQTQAFIDALAQAGGPPIYTLSPVDARQVLRGAQASDAGAPAAEIMVWTIDGGEIGPVSLRIVRPERVNEMLPAVLYVHGGGWVLGDFDTHLRLVHELAIGAGVAVVFVEYTPSPEAKFPVAIEQCFAALKWIVEHGTEAGIDPSRVAIAGDSVGGNMSAAVTLLAKRRGGVSLRMQLLFYPVTDASMDSGSYRQFADGPWLTRAAMEWFWDQYLPDALRRADPLVSPLRATDEELRGLPPALVITDENDVLRDEGEAYAVRLTQAGVKVTAVRYLGTIHDFVMLNAIGQTPAARGAIHQAIHALREALR